MNQTAVELI